MSVIDKAAEVANKLPKNATSAKLLGLAIATVVALAWWVIGSTAKAFQPFVIPSCYWEGYGRAYDPGKENPEKLFKRPIDQARINWDVPEMKKAMELCKPEACSGEAFKEYKSAVFSYVSGRMRQMHQADMRAGERGMLFVLRKYQTNDHDAIVEGLRARVQSGVYKLTGDIQNEDAIRMLVYNPVETFRPCRAKKYEDQWRW